MSCNDGNIGLQTVSVSPIVKNEAGTLATYSPTIDGTIESP